MYDVGSGAPDLYRSSVLTWQSAEDIGDIATDNVFLRWIFRDGLCICKRVYGRCFETERGESNRVPGIIVVGRNG